VKQYVFLFKYVLRHWRGRLLILVVTLLTGAFGLLQPWPMKILVDNVLGKKQLSPGLHGLIGILPGASTPLGLLPWVVLAGLIVFGGNSLMDLVLNRAWIQVSQAMVYDLGSDLFAHVQRQSLLFHSRNPVGDSMSRITGDSWAVFTVVETLLFGPLTALITLTGIIVVMVHLNVGLTFVSLGAAVLSSVIPLFTRRRMRQAARAQRDVQSQLQSHVQRVLSGVAIVQAFTQEERELGRFREITNEAVRVQFGNILVTRFTSLNSGLVGVVATAAIIWVGAHDVIAGRLTIGSLLVFLAYLGTLQAQIRSLSGVYIGMQGAAASADRVREVFDQESEVKEEAGARRLEAVKGHVQFDGITFGYEPDRPVLRDINLEILPGETIAIVGPTGVGKSTLVSLIPRFFDPWEGRVLVDGHDVRDLQIKSLREQVALVLQEPFLFPVSLAENIAYGRPDASRAEIEAAARAANAHPFIERLTEGYDTVVGERGATLSGGERQRISIARALLKDAPILILDEPTSALDAETEVYLLEALERLMEGRTTFIIAHRLSTIRRADRIAVLSEGRIVELETHDALLAQGGIYARLHSLQSGARPSEVSVGAPR